MNENNCIAFFDFDGTITNRDIFWDYVFYRIKNGLSLLKVISCLPVFSFYLLKIVDNESAKQQIFGKLFKGETLSDFEAGIKNYYATTFSQHRLRQDAIDKILWHKNSNHEVYLVSANFDLLLKNFVREYDLKLISTQLQVQNNLITGKFASPNCYGIQKAIRIKNEIPDLNSYEKIYAYGDSKGDLQMLELASEKFYAYFKK